ncbi:MAG: hypothetical protein QGH14_05245 [Candidatus Bathyarchaeota archaeon]|nr:hypothetical protein [Candidatus Bathyarchaeota archaeon]
MALVTGKVGLGFVEIRGEILGTPLSRASRGAGGLDWVLKALISTLAL